MKTTKTVAVFLLLIILSTGIKSYSQSTPANRIAIIGMDTTNPGGFNCPATIAIYFKLETQTPHSKWFLYCPTMIAVDQTGEWSADAGAIIRADISAPLKRSDKYYFEAFVETNDIKYKLAADSVTNLPGRGCDATIVPVNITPPSTFNASDAHIELALNASYCGISGVDETTTWHARLKNTCNDQEFFDASINDAQNLYFSDLTPGTYIVTYDYLAGFCVDTSGLTTVIVPNIDGSTISVKSKYYKDEDGDLFGDDIDFVESCTPVDNRVLAAGDCDDNDATVNPGKTEIPGNEKDDDCDGAIDEEVILATYYADFDHDGFGNPAFPLQAEEGRQPTGYVINNVDCDDTDPEVPTQDLSIKPLWHITNPNEIGYYASSYKYKRGKNKLPVALASTNDSGVVVAGTKFNLEGSIDFYYGNSNNDFYLQKIDKNGQKIWEKYFSLNNGFITTNSSSSTQVSWSVENVTDVAKTTDGGFVIGGTSFYGKKNSYSWCVVDRVTCIQCPETTCSLAPLYASVPLIIKTDASGTQLWSWTLQADLLYNTELFSIKETKDKGIVCLGRKRRNTTMPGEVINSSNWNPDSIPDENTKYYVVKLSSNGSLVWQQDIDFLPQKQIKDYFFASPVDITETSDGNFICTGNNAFYKSAQQEYANHNVLFKLSSGGQLIWSINTDEIKTPGLVTAADNGSFYFAADNEPSAQSQKIQVRKMDGSGNILWVKFLNAGDFNFSIPAGIQKAVSPINISYLDTNSNGNLVAATSSKLYQFLPNGDLFKESKIDSSNYAGTISADKGFYSLQFNEISGNTLKLSKYAEPQVNDLCNGKDDDCDGLIDEDAPQDLWYRDNDNDGFGNPNDTIRNCAQPEGYVNDSTDCNDLNALVNPDAKEICNGIDDDCNGIVDDLFPAPIIISPVENPVSLCFDYRDPPLTAIQGDNFSYQWKLDGQNITGATTAYLQPAVAGGYRVRVFTPGGCSVFSEVKRVRVTQPVTATITPAYDLDLCTTPKRGQALLKGPQLQNVSYVWQRINNDGSIDILGVSKNYTATVAGEYRLTVRTIPDCYESSAIVTVTGNCTSGIAMAANDTGDEVVMLKETKLLLYPNPAKDILHVSGLANTKGNIEIINITGQKIYSQQVYGNNANINISTFANGVYLFKYTNGATIKTIKFIKQ